MLTPESQKLAEVMGAIQLGHDLHRGQGPARVRSEDTWVGRELLSYGCAVERRSGWSTGRRSA